MWLSCCKGVSDKYLDEKVHKSGTLLKATNFRDVTWQPSPRFAASLAMPSRQLWKNALKKKTLVHPLFRVRWQIA
jgi:hypothetical protein